MVVEFVTQILLNFIANILVSLDRYTIKSCSLMFLLSLIILRAGNAVSFDKTDLQS